MKRVKEIVVKRLKSQTSYTQKKKKRRKFLKSSVDGLRKQCPLPNSNGTNRTTHQSGTWTEPTLTNMIGFLPISWHQRAEILTQLTLMAHRMTTSRTSQTSVANDKAMMK